MNDSPNTTAWAIGDIVIHDADHKSNAMLMIVLGHTRDGLVITRYVQDRLWKRYVNETRFLHDPHRPDIQARWLGDPPA